MKFHIFIVSNLVLINLIKCQMQYSQTNTNSPSISTENYLVGNLSQSFSFQVAPSTIQVTYLGLNGYSLYIKGVGFSNKSEFNYDETNNRLTIHSLDLTTVGYYSAVDTNWKTYTTILSAINVSSLEIHNSRVSEDNNGTSLVSCSVSIIRSTFKLPESHVKSSKVTGTEYLPRLDLFLSTRLTSTVLMNKKFYNDTLNEHNFTRTVILEQGLTRADHNGTIQCQVESNNNIDVYLIKTVPINIEFGPNLETGASLVNHLESEMLKSIQMECQIEANPSPSYIWYEISSNISTEIMLDYESQRSYQQSSSLQSVFGTKRQIERIYQYPGKYVMQCQAQSRGKTMKQEFYINVIPSTNTMKINSNVDNNGEKSSKFPVIIGISIGSILILLVFAILIATIIYLKREKKNLKEKTSIDDEKATNDKQGKSRWNGLPVDYSKYKHESLKVDSSSTSHLVESAETASIQSPPAVPVRPSPMPSTHSSYRQAPSTTVSFSYRQASALPGFRSIDPTPSQYSPERNDDDDDGEDGSTSINAIPLTVNRSRTNTPFGSHKSLSESIQSLRSNQHPAVCLPVKKRSNDPTSNLSKREQKSPSPRTTDTVKDYQHHHYHNPEQLRSQQQIKQENKPQENNIFEPSPSIRSTTASLSGYSQVNFPQTNEQQRGKLSSSSDRKVVHPTNGINFDEVPPSYNQVAHAPSPSHGYIYQEPTEV